MYALNTAIIGLLTITRKVYRCLYYGIVCYLCVLACIKIHCAIQDSITEIKFIKHRHTVSCRFLFMIEDNSMPRISSCLCGRRLSVPRICVG